jgi:hypothetical protein
MIARIGTPWVIIERIWTGEVCVRSTSSLSRRPGGGFTKKVSCMSRAG